MNKLLLSACAAVLIATGASAAHADQYDRVGGAGVVIRIGDHYQDDYPFQDYGYNGYGNYGCCNSGYGNGYGYNNSDYGYGNNYGYGNGYSYGNNYGYYNRGYYPIPPGAIVQSLYRSGFSYIQQPQFANGQYQVRARDPNGRGVKIYVDAFNGQILRVKH